MLTETYIVVTKWNSNLDFSQIVFVNVDQLTYPNIYVGHRFCEPGVKEVQADADQFTVAVFYPNAGPDTYPQGESITADSDWGYLTIDSATCGGESFSSWTGTMWCDLAVAATTNATLLQAIEADVTTGDTIVGYSTSGSDVTIRSWTLSMLGCSIQNLSIRRRLLSRWQIVWSRTEMSSPVHLVEFLVSFVSFHSLAQLACSGVVSPFSARVFCVNLTLLPFFLAVHFMLD
jgi:hypothetical protein